MPLPQLGIYHRANASFQMRLGVLTMLHIPAVLLAVLICGSAYSSDKPNFKIAEPKDTSDTKHRGSATNPLTVKILPSPNADAKAAQEEKHRNEKVIQDEKLVDATVWLARITGVLALFTGGLWWARDAKQTAARQSGEMQASLRIAQESADAAKRSVELAREEFIATYCPRLIIRRINIYQSSDVSPEIHYEIANIGGTQAKIIAINTRLWMPDSNSMPPITPEVIGDNDLGIILESGSVLRNKQPVPTQDCGLLCMQLSYHAGESVQPEQSRTYFLGHIIYRDQLDRRFETGFLRQYDFSAKRFIAVNDPDYEYLV
jgi:hypothetical protein